MRRGLVCLAMMASVASPVLAIGYDKLELFRAMDLAEGKWVTVLTIEKMLLTPDETTADDPDVAAKVRDAEAQAGRTFETTDCLGNQLSPRGELVLPGVAIASDCTISDQAVSADNFTLTARCGKQSDFSLTFEGSKSRTAIDGMVEMQGVGGGMTMAITTRIRSKWVGACTAR